MLPVVFLHSAAGSPAQWATQLNHLDLERPARALPLPGHAGASPLDAYTIEALADALRPEIRDLGRVALAGHSGGAVVAVRLAELDPDRVAGLLLVDPGTDGRAFPREQAEPMLAALRSDAYAETAGGYWNTLLDDATDATRALVVSDFRRTPRDVIPDMLESLGTYDAVTPLRSFATTHPVALVATPRSEGPDVLWNESVEVVRVEGTSHWVQLDRPDVVNDALDRLLVRAEGTLPTTRP